MSFCRELLDRMSFSLKSRRVFIYLVASYGVEVVKLKNSDANDVVVGDVVDKELSVTVG
jgi:hypothetical protein